MNDTPSPSTSATTWLALAARLRWGPTGSGTLAGRDRGGRLGRAGEFEEYRPWRPGEDLRSLDARVYRRLRRRVARVDREDSALPLTLLIDRSASMADPARRVWTREIATFLVALARARGEPRRVLFLEASGVRQITAHDPGSLAASLEEAPPRGTVSVAAACAAVPPAPVGAGRVVLLSDGFGLDDERSLISLEAHGRPIWLAPWLRTELLPEVGGAVRLVSREGEPAWTGTLDRATIDRYVSRHRAWWRRWVSHFRARGGEAQRCVAEDGALATIETGLAHGRWIRR